MSCRQRDAATHIARLQVGWLLLFMEGLRFWSQVQIPKIANFFFLTDDGQRLVDK